MNRRTILKSTGIGVSGIATVPTLGSARPSDDVTGISYDTLTQESGTVVKGTINNVNSGLRGALSIAGYTIPLQKLERRTTPQREAGERFSAALTADRFVKDGYPLKVTIKHHGDHFSGILSRPSSEFGHLGFYVRDATEMNPQEELEHNRPDPQWESLPTPSAVGKNGLPVGSSPKQIKKLDRPRDNKGKIGGDY